VWAAREGRALAREGGKERWAGAGPAEGAERISFSFSISISFSLFLLFLGCQQKIIYVSWVPTKKIFYVMCY
jgi:hypothetical protein